MMTAVDIRMRRDGLGRLIVEIPGRDPVVSARLAQCFPWTHPKDYLSILDSEGKEVRLIRSLDELDEAGQRLVEEEIADKVFRPRLRKVLSFKREFGIVTIHAETDRGPVTFFIRSRDDIRVLSRTRALFRDPDGNTFELADINELDPVSRKYLDDYL
jgi:catechol 2,3-dioxygenase-like lactoylglutathione lyase family enzyme